MSPPSTPIAHVSYRDLDETISALRASGTLRLDDAEAAALAWRWRMYPARYGSLDRVLKPGRRGGDIDVLILTREPAFETSRKVAMRFFSMCEEKIDVVVFDPERLTAEQTDFISRINRVRLAQPDRIAHEYLPGKLAKIYAAMVTTGAAEFRRLYEKKMQLT